MRGQSEGQAEGCLATVQLALGVSHSTQAPRQWKSTQKSWSWPPEGTQPETRLELPLTFI